MTRLVFWVGISKLFTISLILFAGIGLMPDEAQYWTWAKELSYGYYSKPPGIAWQIAAGCALFGDTELGVRAVGVLFSFFLSLAIYFVARECHLDEKKCFWAAIAFSFCPLGIFSGFFATTDCPYVLFWTITVLLFLRSYSFSVIGLVIALGALWKWPIYTIWLPIALFSYRQPVRVLVGFAISLIGLIPSLIWNMKTGFVTFQHVATSITQTATKANPLQFLGAQVALVSPILFGLIIFGMCRMRGQNRPLWFCWVCSFLFFIAVFGASFFEKVQGNWAAVSFPTAFVVMAYYVSSRWMLGGIITSLALIAAILLAPLPYKMNPFKQGLGSENIQEALVRSDYNPDKDFLFSDRYQMTSLLSFYGPQQKRAYFFNIHGLRHNQFDFWPQMRDECANKTGYFVEFANALDAAHMANRLQLKLKDYFADVTLMPIEPIYKSDKVAIILRATNYNAKSPPSVNKY
ncbi:MAG: glycosyltransferase family 39 protein [Chlamydiales bacterium]|nr:glycosyltransferase family 39 protein [Chlamydiales bacterium]